MYNKVSITDPTTPQACVATLPSELLMPLRKRVPCAMWQS